MFFKIFIFLLFFIKSSYAHELRPAIANLNIYEKDNIINATLSIRLNLEAIIAEVNMDHSNTEESEKSGQYESLRTMNADELLKKFNSKIRDLQNKIYLTSANSNYGLTLVDVDIPEVGNTDIIRDTVINFDIKNIKDEDLKFSWDKSLGSIILRVNSKNNEGLYSKLIESNDKSEWFSITNKREERLIDNVKSYTQLGFKHIIPKGFRPYIICYRFISSLFEIKAFGIAGFNFHYSAHNNIISWCFRCNKNTLNNC